MLRQIAILALSFTLLAGSVHGSASRRYCPNPYAVAQHFGTYEGVPGWANGHFDLNNDGAVTVGDIILASNCWLA